VLVERKNGLVETKNDLVEKYVASGPNLHAPAKIIPPKSFKLIGNGG
jgi:hypothetical protein